MNPVPTKVVSKLPADLAGSFSATQVDLIKSVIAKDATDDELKLFLYTAKRTGLDPLTRQIYFQKRKSKQKDGTYKEQMVILTGIDGYRAIATRSGELAGEDDVVFDSETGVYPTKATVTVYRMVGATRCPFTATARWGEYVAVGYDGKPSQMWAKMPYLMLGKCAAALAYRKAFPNDISGIYTTEEMQQADNPVTIAPIESPVAREFAPTKKITPKVVQEPAEGFDSSVMANSEQLPTVAMDDIPVIEGTEEQLGPTDDDVCPVCKGPISVAEVGFSQRVFGKVMCRQCQADFKAMGGK